MKDHHKKMSPPTRPINSAPLLIIGVLLLTVTIHAFSIMNSASSSWTHNRLIEHLKQQTDSAFFWHVTDPHLDAEYAPGSNINCGQLVCCRKSSPVTNTSSPAGRFGAYGPCDGPLETFVSALNFMKNYPIEAEFLFYGG